MAKRYQACNQNLYKSVLLWYTDSDYTLGIFWPLCCLFFYVIQILITRLISFSHCAVCSSIIYRLCLHPWYLLTTVLSVLLWYPDSDYPLVSFGHCVVCSSMIYRFWLHPWYLLAIVFIEEQTIKWPKSNYTLGIFWPLYCLFFYDIQILITPLVYFGHFIHRRTDNTMTKRYQGGNQNLYIIEEQKTQWPKDTKGVIRICIS